MRHLKKYDCTNCHRMFPLLTLRPLIWKDKYWGRFCDKCFNQGVIVMFDKNGEINWTYYYSELVKARSDRIKWAVGSFLLGVAASTSVFVILVQYLQSIP